MGRSASSTTSLDRGLPDIRRPVLIAAAGAALVSLLVAIEAGLDRLGIGLVAPAAATVPHGGLMVGGFVGTLIALERARASDRAAAYMVPLSSALGAVLLVAGADVMARGMFIVAALGLALLMAWFWRIQPQLPIALVAIGALAWAGASITWARTATPVQAVPWWAAFIALTILGERLELTRFSRRSTRPALLAAVLTVVALLVSTIAWELGVRLLGGAFLVAGLWLLWADTARSTVRRGGLASYAGVALLAAYGWLTLAGMALLTRGLLGPWYDATLHGLFIGFGMGAIFAHGPIILPALTGRSVRLTLLLPLALTILHASLGLRVAATLLGEPAWRQTAAVMHVVAFTAYLLAMAVGSHWGSTAIRLIDPRTERTYE